MLRNLTQHAESTTRSILSKLKSAADYKIKIGNNYELSIGHFSLKNGYRNTISEAKYLFKLTLFCGLPLANGDVVMFLDNVGKTLYLVHYSLKSDADVQEYSDINFHADLAEHCGVQLLDDDKDMKILNCFYGEKRPSHNMSHINVWSIYNNGKTAGMMRGVDGLCFNFNLGNQPGSNQTENCTEERAINFLNSSHPFRLNALEIFGIVGGSITLVGLAAFGIWKWCQRANTVPAPAAAAAIPAVPFAAGPSVPPHRDDEVVERQPLLSYPS